jgi:hypothetical protein
MEYEAKLKSEIQKLTAPPKKRALSKPKDLTIKNFNSVRRPQTGA